MAITIIPPPTAITSFNATVISGGELEPDTTYEFGIVVKNVSSYLTSVSSYMTPLVSGLETTDTVNKSITLTWDYKSGYPYYIIGWKRSTDIHWKALTYNGVGQYTRYCLEQADCTITFDNEAEYASGGDSHNNAYIFAHFQADFDTQVPMDIDTGTGRLEISGTAGDLTVEDLLSGVESAGMSDLFKYDGTSIHSRLHLWVSSGTTGSLDLEYMDFYFYQCIVLNSSSTFTMNMTSSRMNVVTYGWRCDTQYCDYTNATIQGGAYGNIRASRMHDRTTSAYLYSGNIYVFAKTTSIMTGVIVRGLQMQIYAGTTIEDANLSTLRVNTINTIDKTTVKNTEMSLFYILYNVNWATFTPLTDYEFRGITTSNVTYDLVHYYDTGYIYVYDFNGLGGYNTYGSWNKPRIRWISGLNGGGKYKFFRDLQLLIIDENGTAVPSASIVINNKDGVLLTSGISDGNGKWNEDIQVSDVQHDGISQYGNIHTMNTPFEIIISKTGYVKVHLNTDYQKTIEIPILLRTFASLPAHKVATTTITKRTTTT